MLDNSCDLRVDRDRQLWRDGAVLLGKTNTDEFAMGSSNETSVFGRHLALAAARVEHAAGSRRLLRRLGGGGGGKAVPRGDRHRHRGSIRQPAAFTGIAHQAHLWPLLALGHRAYASSLDQAGRCAQVRDAAILLPLMAGHDPKDTTRSISVPDYEAAVRKIVQGA